jgi:hypothetical protein
VRAPAVLLFAIAGCTAARPAPPTPRWDYVVDAPAAGSTVLRVEARFVGAGTPVLAIDDEVAPLVRDFAIDDGAGWKPAPPPDEATWRAPACARACSVRYAIDLAALAEACEDSVDCALASRDAILSPALAWLLHPKPRGDAPVTVRFRAADPARVLTGLRPSFRSQDIAEGSFTAFGAVRRGRVEAAGAAIDVGLLGPPLAMGDDATLAWIADAARCDATLYGRFGVDRATVFVVPMTEVDDVLFGKVLALAGPSVVLLVGRAMRAESTHRDWVLVHELFHLGFPSFPSEARWLGEGLATYYEPVLRARCGWIAPDEAWRGFAERMPRGVARAGEGLDGTDDFDAIYWGGALFALAADVAIRRETGGARSLDDWLRAVSARGGDASRLWSLDDVMREGDHATGTDVLTTMRARVAVRGEPIDAAKLLAALGVSADGTRDDAPLAAIRRAITAPR